MTGYKTYFMNSVKDDLPRFFFEVGMLPTLILSTRKRGDNTGFPLKSLIARGFETIRVFQRYPNLLETDR
jgi:hypothetical protein